MKKLIIVLGICLLGFGCDKVENDDDQIRQNEINRQFIGLWKYAVPHDKNTEPQPDLLLISNISVIIFLPGRNIIAI